MTARRLLRIVRRWLTLLVLAGLLCAAETYESGRKVYEMGEDRFSAPLEEGMVFSLPDGTVLHESSAVAVPEE